MKILSKSILASIFSTVVAASAMAQCPSGGCPWGSYNRNYGGGYGGGYGQSYDYSYQGYPSQSYSNYGYSSYPSQSYSNYGYSSYPSQSYSNYGYSNFDDHNMGASHSYPYPYGGQVYSSDFEAGPRGNFGYDHSSYHQHEGMYQGSMSYPAHDNSMYYDRGNFGGSMNYDRNYGNNYDRGYGNNSAMDYNRGYGNSSYNTTGNQNYGNSSYNTTGNQNYGRSAGDQNFSGSNPAGYGDNYNTSTGSSSNNPSGNNASMNNPSNNAASNPNNR